MSTDDHPEDRDADERTTRDHDQTEDLAVQNADAPAAHRTYSEPAYANPPTEKRASRWAGTGDRVRQHPVGVAIGTGVAALVVGGILGASLFGGHTANVGSAGMSHHYSAQGDASQPGPPPLPGGEHSDRDERGGPGGPGGPGGEHSDRGGPGGPGGPPPPPGGERGGPGGQIAGPPPPPAAGGPGQAAPGAPGQAGPGNQPPAPPQPNGSAPAAPTTPLLPAEQPAR